MPLKTVTTAGTRVQLTTTATPASRITLQYLGNTAGSTVYVGVGVNAVNTGSAVASTAYDLFLNAANPSATIGMGETNANSVDANNVWLDASANGEGVAWFVEQI